MNWYGNQCEIFYLKNVLKINVKIMNIESLLNDKLNVISLLSTRSRNNSAFDSGSSSSDISEISERMRKTCGIRQQTTLDCDMYSGKRLSPAALEPRRASITIAPRYLQF